MHAKNTQTYVNNYIGSRYISNQWIYWDVIHTIILYGMIIVEVFIMGSLHIFGNDNINRRIFCNNIGIGIGNGNGICF